MRKRLLGVMGHKLSFGGRDLVHRSTLCSYPTTQSPSRQQRQRPQLLPEEISREQTYFDRAWEARERSRQSLDAAAAAGIGGKSSVAVAKAAKRTRTISVVLTRPSPWASIRMKPLRP